MKPLLHLLIFVLLTSPYTSYAQTPVRLKRVMIERYNPQQNNYIPEDSVEYYYSAGNSGFIADEEVRCATPFTRFDIAKYYAGMAYDSAIFFNRHSINPTSPSLKNIQLINHDKTIDRAVWYSANSNWSIGDSTINTYTNGRLTKQETNNKTSEYFYGSGGMLDSIKTNNGSSTSTIAYSYTNNKLSVAEYLYIGPSTTSPAKTIYQYSSANVLPDKIITTIHNANTTQWDTINIKEYSYNSNQDLTQEKYWEYNMYGQTGIKLAYRIDIQYDNNSRRVTDIIWADFYKHGSQAGLIKYMRKQYTYNQFDKLATYDADHWDDMNSIWVPSVDTSIGWDSKMKFEYEVYWPANVQQQKQNIDNIAVYPSPASDFVIIHTQFDIEEEFVVRIFDMQGRTVRQWKENPVKDYIRTVPLTELPAGQYVLKLSGNNLNTSKQFFVMK